MYPPNLYKGTLWTAGGGDRLMYVGVQDQYYTFTMFDAQARWAVRYIAGEITLPGKEGVEASLAEWKKK